ncbi:hypothetical protein BDV96DRAFT_577857 [Lophiotrema nucula]|uniref:Secreted protein n=1 Tax=Lophiotrema nucula TaxID=690887 RepID=A0A6A5Z4C1_9PLEO|nr:hypothetical protein BDV96DRAFT_577857 [Lophiotrema nucula]
MMCILVCALRLPCVCPQIPLELRRLNFFAPWSLSPRTTLHICVYGTKGAATSFDLDLQSRIKSAASSASWWNRTQKLREGYRSVGNYGGERRRVGEGASA